MKKPVKNSIKYYVGLEEVEPTDCISRSVHLARYEKGQHQIRFVTRYDAKEDLISTLNLTESAFDILAMAILKLIGNPSEFVYKPQSVSVPHEPTKTNET